MFKYNPLFSSFSLQVIFFSEQTFYGNYSTLGSHTNTIISHTLAYSSRWRRKPWQGLFKFPSLPFRSVSSSCFGSLDIRSPGVFTETFLDHYHLDICKSNAKTHKIISINRFGITCFYFSSRNIPAIALFAATFLSNLVLSRSNQCFGCGLDQSHCRKLHIQIGLWPGLYKLSLQSRHILERDP